MPVRTACSTGPAGVVPSCTGGWPSWSGTGWSAVRGRRPVGRVDLDPARGTGRAISEAMARRGVLVKDTHGATIRLSPPLVVSESELDLAVDVLAEVLTKS